MSTQWPDMSRLKKLASELKFDEDMTRLGGNVEVFQTENYREKYSAAITACSLEDVEQIEEFNYEEIDKEDNDNQEIMQWIAEGSIPPTMESALALNQCYQEALQRLMNFFQDKRDNLRSKQNYISNVLDANRNVIPAKKLSAKVPALLYIPPYFRDSAEMCPPTNDESRENPCRMDLDMLVQRSRKWTEREEMKLKEAVHQNNFDKLIRPFLSIKDILTEKKKHALLHEVTNSENIKQLTAELQKVTKEIRLLKKKREKGQLDLNGSDEIIWSHLAVNAFEGSRRPIECQLAWMNEFHPKINRGNWKKEEILNLKKIVESKSELHWDEIAVKLGTNRTAFQCAEKYQMELNDSLTRKQWRPEEDRLLIEAIEQNKAGNYIHWDQVVSNLDGRTRTQCQIRWSRTLNPNLKHGRWDEEEDKRLLRAVNKFGTKDWGKIAELVSERTDSQCRERWCTVLDVGIKDDRWTEKEDAILKVGVRAFGRGQWAKVRRLLPGRTAAMCKTRFFSLKKLLMKLNKNGKKSTKTVKKEPGVVKQNGNRKFMKKHNVERKNRVRDWFLNNHGPLPKPGLDKDVGTFLNSLPEKLKDYIESNLAEILAE